MTIWGCNCTGDPVGESARGIVAAVLRGRSKTEQEALLQAAQKALVQRVCDSCWPSGREELLWVQTYVEIERGLEAMIRGQGDASLTEEWFLHRAAGISTSDEHATEFYDKVLIPQLKNVPETDWLSNLFSHPDCPPVVCLWMDNDDLKCDWTAISVPTLYRALFVGERGGGEYVHIAYPCRGTDLSAHVGPAGAYLFRRRRDGQLPGCLLFHMRAFVQSLVTAQLWAIARHLRRELHDATQLFRRNPGTLRLFADAAEKLAVMGDPLEFETRAFAEAQAIAKQLFASSELHTVDQWMAREGAAAETLLKLASDLKRAVEKYADDSVPLVEELACTIGRSVAEGRVREALVHAKALDHHSVRVSLLVKAENGDPPMAEIAPHNTARPENQDQANRFLRQAIVRLWGLSRRYVFSYQKIAIGGKKAVSGLNITYGFEVRDLVESALALLKGEWGDRERDESQRLAVVLRGLRGMTTDDNSRAFGEIVLGNSDSETVFIPFYPRIE